MDYDSFSSKYNINKQDIDMNIIFSSEGNAEQDLDNFASYLVQILLDALGKYAHRKDAIIVFEKDAIKEEINEMGEFIKRHVKVDIQDNFDCGTLKIEQGERWKN